MGLKATWLYPERRLEGPHNLTIMLEQKFPFARGPRVDQTIPIDHSGMSAESQEQDLDLTVVQEPILCRRPWISASFAWKEDRLKASVPIGQPRSFAPLLAISSPSSLQILINLIY